MAKENVKLSRMFKLLERIQAGYSNIRTLCQEFSLSERQIYRYIVDLRYAGFDIRRDRGSGNYKVFNQIQLPVKQLDDEEVLFLLTVCHEAGSNNPLPYLHPISRAAAKIHNSLPLDIRSKAESIGAAFEILRKPVCQREETQAVFTAVLQSYRNKNSLRIRYVDDEGRKIETRLSPYRLFYRNGNWHVVGQSTFHWEIALFFLDRITEFEKTEHFYGVPPEFSLKRLFKNAWDIRPEPGPDREIHLRFSHSIARDVAEKIWHHTQRIQWREDGSLDFHVTVSGLKEISCWILGYGREVEVLNPKELREIIKENAEEMIRRYREP